MRFAISAHRWRARASREQFERAKTSLGVLSTGLCQRAYKVTLASALGPHGTFSGTGTATSSPYHSIIMSAQPTQPSTVTGLQNDANKVANDLHNEASKAADKVSSGADKLADKAQQGADDVAPKSEGQSLLEQGQKLFNDTTSYVQKQAGQVFGEGKEATGAGAGAGAAAGSGSERSVTDQARQYASDALNSVSELLQKGGDKASAASQDAAKPDGTAASYVEQARAAASDLLQKAQEQLNSGASATGAAAK